MTPSQGFQKRQDLLKEIASAQEDKKLAEKNLELKTYNRDALQKALKALPDLEKQRKETSLARFVDTQTDALREEIAKDRSALDVEKKKAKDEAAALEKKRKDEEQARKKKEQEEARKKSEEEQTRLKSLSEDERKAEAARKLEEKKRALEEAKREKAEKAEKAASSIEKEVVPEKVDPFAERDRLISEKKERLEALTAVQRMLQPEPWMENSQARAKMAIDEAEKEIAKAKETLDSKTLLLADAQARYQPYLDTVKELKLEESFYESFEKDISQKKARELEEELATLRGKLKEKFPPEAVKTTSHCNVRKQLEEHISALEKEIDARAHKAKCHKCGKENGIARGEKAKKLILDKVAELKRIAEENGNTPDHQLARALHKFDTTADENGAFAGKMLGVLICQDEFGEEVLVWAYSGLLNPDSRSAGADEVKLQRLLEAPDAMKETVRELEEAKKELERRQKDDAAYQKVVKQIDTNLKDQNAERQKAFDTRRRMILDREDEIRKKAGEQQKAATDAAKQQYEKVASLKDEGLEGAKHSYTEALLKANEDYRKIASESQERQRVDLEKAQQELKAAQGEARSKAEVDKEEAFKKFQMEAFQEVKKKENQLQKEKAELEERIQKRTKTYGDDESKLKDAIARAKEAGKSASERDTLTEKGTAPAWERPVGALLKSKSGDAEKLTDLNHEHEGTPHGVCSAPKMIQAAYGRKLKPVSMAEAWYGRGTNTHGELVASCNTCMKNIGFQLCEEKHAQ